MSPEDRHLEQLLVAACQAGEAAARQQLFDQYQPGLLRYCTRLLRGQPDRQTAAEDLAQDVWRLLYKNDGKRLKNYDPGEALFATYLHWLAKQLLYMWHRRLQSQQAHEIPLGERDPPDPHTTDGFMQIQIDEFGEHLPPQEQKYFQECLLENRPPAVSPANARQLHHRVEVKVRTFFLGS